MIDISQHNEKGEQASTCYTGTKDDLTNAGLATPLMFETTQGRARTSRLCKNYHPESGDWKILNRGKYRNKQLIWHVIYYHERFMDAATLKIEKEVMELAKKIKELPGENGEKLRNLVRLSICDQFASATMERVVRGEISMKECLDIVWEYTH